MSKKHAMHFAEVGRKNANRLSKQNYCTMCEYRVKEGKYTMCVEYNARVNDVISFCKFLKPFDKYKEEHANGNTNRNDGTIQESK
jgi:hypothetical protein